MNPGIFRITIMAALIFSFSGCSMDQEVTDVFDLSVSQIEHLYQPENGKSIQLSASSQTPQVRFEWEPAMANDNGMVLYELKFDKANGDFSNPIAVFPSNNNGKNNFFDIGHKDLNRLAASADIESNEWGILKWTVFASKGINPVKADLEYTLIVKRLAGITPPDAVYLTGAATEAGDNLADALIMKQIADGECELFTLLMAGQTFRFVDATVGSPTVYGLVGQETLVEDQSGSCTVATTGVYRINLDFNSAVVKFSEVARVCLFPNAAQSYVDMTYAGFGVWELVDHEFDYGAGDYGNTDDRYKFRMVYAIGHPTGGPDHAITEWRTLLPNDSKPGPTPTIAWYYMEERLTPHPLQQWTNNEIWKREGATWNGAKYNAKFILKPDAPYTHTFVRTEM